MMQTLSNGSQLGDYRIVRLLARGGMGEVYEAQDIVLQRQVALKIITTAEDEHNSVQRFIQEARTLAKMNHPNIVTIHSIHTSGATQYIAMEYIEGVSLKDFLAEYELTPEITAFLFEQMLLGVRRLHEFNIVHRDLKPGNILIRVDGQIKILDFGIAKTLEALDNTNPKFKLGTPYYMAPELKDTSAATIRSDFWSLGAVLYECLTGKYMATALDGDDLVLSKKDLSLIPLDLRAMIGAMCAPNPLDRYQSADEILRELHRCQSATEGLSPETLTAFRRCLKDMVDAKRSAQAMAPDDSALAQPSLSEPISKGEAFELRDQGTKPTQTGNQNLRRRRSSLVNGSSVQVLISLVIFALLGLFTYRHWIATKRIYGVPVKPIAATPVPTPLELVAPTDRQVMWLEGREKLSLSWSIEIESDSYWIQIARDERFQQVLVNEPVTGNQVQITKIPEGLYFWRLQSNNPASATIGPRRFSVVHGEPVQPLKPEDHWVAPGPEAAVAFEWTCKPIAGNYVIQVATDESFQQLIKSQDTTNCQWNDFNLSQGTYFWRVRFDVGAAHPEHWSSPRSFQVKSSPPAEIRIAAPAVNSIEETSRLNRFVKLSWSSVPGAKRYRIQLSRLKNFEEPFVDESVLSTTWRWKASQSGRVYWRVAGISPSKNQGAFSNPGRVQVNGPRHLVPSQDRVAPAMTEESPAREFAAAPVKDLPAPSPAIAEVPVPLLLMPPEGARAPAKNGKISIEFSWSHAKNADSYELQLSTDPDFADVVKQVSSSEPRALLEQVELSGRIYWRVQTQTGDQTSKWSEVRYLEVH